MKASHILKTLKASPMQEPASVELVKVETVKMKEKLELANLIATTKPAFSHSALYAFFDGVEFEQCDLASVLHNGQWFPVSFNGLEWETGWI